LSADTKLFVIIVVLFFTRYFLYYTISKKVHPFIFVITQTNVDQFE